MTSCRSMEEVAAMGMKTNIWGKSTFSGIKEVKFAFIQKLEIDILYNMPVFERRKNLLRVKIIVKYPQRSFSAPE